MSWMGLRGSPGDAGISPKRKELNLRPHSPDGEWRAATVSSGSHLLWPQTEATCTHLPAHTWRCVQCSRKPSSSLWAKPSWNSPTKQEGLQRKRQKASPDLCPNNGRFIKVLERGPMVFPAQKTCTFIHWLCLCMRSRINLLRKFY